MYIASLIGAIAPYQLI